jgi:TRAP-type C4-dicarboxylate transport system permease small subunit
VRRLERIAATAFGSLAAVALAGVMLVVVADVVLRSFFGYPVRGQFELVEIGLSATVFLALPAVFLQGAHLVVDVADHFVSARVKRLLDLFGGVASLVGLALILWQITPQSLQIMQFGDMSFDLQIPKIWYAVPLLIGIAFSLLAALVVLIRNE